MDEETKFCLAKNIRLKMHCFTCNKKAVCRPVNTGEYDGKGDRIILMMCNKCVKRATKQELIDRSDDQYGLKATDKLKNGLLKHIKEKEKKNEQRH